MDAVDELTADLLRAYVNQGASDSALDLVAKRCRKAAETALVPLVTEAENPLKAVVEAQSQRIACLEGEVMAMRACAKQNQSMREEAERDAAYLRERINELTRLST